MEEGNTEEHDVAYFRQLLKSQTERLNQLCQKWDDIDTTNLSEDGKVFLCSFYDCLAHFVNTQTCNLDA